MSEPPAYLSFNDNGIENASNIVNRCIPLDMHSSCMWIDFDCGQIADVTECDGGSHPVRPVGRVQDIRIRIAVS